MVETIDPDGVLVPRVSLRPIADEPKVLAGRIGSGKYTILKLLGSGGMGDVYLAYDRDLRRHVALKTLRRLGAESRARLIEEAQVMGQLDHPNILCVHEIGLADDGSLYYTMPIVRGETLQRVLARLREGGGTGLASGSLTRLVQILIQVARALDYAHLRGVLHRDLKPSNIMLGEHGEVRILDWGLAKVMGDGRLEARHGSGEGPLPDAHRSEVGRAVGTPAYMSPEQAEGTALGPASEVYSLGVVLYEVLTLRVPFEGPSVKVVAAHLGEVPVRPRLRTPERAVPLELERICLMALAKDPRERHPTAGALGDDLQAWIDAEADTEVRQRRAEERVAAGKHKLEAYRELRDNVARLEREVQDLAARYRPWESVAAKEHLMRLQERLEDARDRLSLEAGEVTATLGEALGFERDNAAARALLADFYFERMREVEDSGGDRRSRDSLHRVVERYHDGRYARELGGDGTLSLRSEPAGAEAWLHDLVEKDLVLVPVNPRLAGKTPLLGLPLAMGSYLVVLRRDGYRDVRYPVRIGRSYHWRGDLSLCTEADIGPDFVYVPGGPFLQGGDPLARGRPLPRAETEVAGFFISRFPITMGEYLDFLNDLARTDRDQARRRSPRHGPVGWWSYLVEGADGRLDLPGVDRDGDRWDRRWPAILISWHDAVAYAGWRSRRDGRPYRLPTDLEMEKAARGVDGRTYPWGNRFDPSLCNLRDSRRERPTVVTVDEFATDESIYGVRGVAGNVQTWTMTCLTIGEGDEARDARVVRGGGWDLGPDDARSATREWNGPDNVTHMTGFRLACPAPR